MGATIAELRADQNSQKRPSELARRANFGCAWRRLPFASCHSSARRA